MTLSLPFDLPEPLAAVALDSGELVTQRKQVCQCFAMCTQSPASMGMCSRQAIKAGLAIKPINRDRVNRPNPLLTFQGNHPLPFHSEPGTPFYMLFARKWHARAAGRMVNRLLETWQMPL